MTAGLTVATTTVAHEHTWRLVSAEYDGSIEVREHQCAGCAEVRFTG